MAEHTEPTNLNPDNESELHEIPAEELDEEAGSVEPSPEQQASTCAKIIVGKQASIDGVHFDAATQKIHLPGRILSPLDDIQDPSTSQDCVELYAGSPPAMKAPPRRKVARNPAMKFVPVQKSAMHPICEPRQHQPLMTPCFFVHPFNTTGVDAKLARWLGTTGNVREASCCSGSGTHPHIARSGSSSVYSQERPSWRRYIARFWGWILRAITKEQLFKLMKEHKSFVLEYLKEEYPLRMVENPHTSELEDKFAWQADLSDDEAVAFFNQAKVDFLNNISQLPGEPNDREFVVVFAEYLIKVFGSPACRIWKMDEENIADIQLLKKNQDDTLTLILGTPHVDVIEAARRSHCLISNRFDTVINLEEEDDCIGLFYSDRDKMGIVSYALLVPLLLRSGDTLYVVEVYRENHFSLVELQIAFACCAWGSIALMYCTAMLDNMLQYELTNHLLSTLKCVFQEMISQDVVIQRILKFVQQLVNADRASLFMLDRAKNQLVSTVFDQKLDRESREKREIRIPMDRGIAGLVATTGELMNIPNAYNDERFNREIDEATGYKTTSILCMPVKVDGEIIGVVQMVNKRNASRFYRDDIHAFDVFESFFGLALHHAKLYETIVRNEQKYKVALEVLSYHITCKDQEVKDFVAMEPHKVDHILDDYYLDPYSLNAKMKCQAVMVMFDDLFGMTHFDSMELTRFTLTVMKNYRNVPYHNFNHGWAVAQTMYAILKNDDEKRFNNKQRLALFVASLCHDLDHRGYTNKYMSETESPLAAMYTTSTLEHHHFNTTVRILQQEGHNIFSKFSGEEYKEILSLIRVCILATDLAVFYQNMYEIKKIIFAQSWFDWEELMMQEYGMALSMTAADLSASAKPWNVQIKTVLVIIEEFYRQGDMERAAGRVPIAMMDRTRPEELPINQVGFLTSTCIPCYKMLKFILPGTVDLYDMAEENLERWKVKVKEKELLGP